jgi:hypothetical protein
LCVCVRERERERDTLLYAGSSLILEEDGIEGRNGNASIPRSSLEADSNRQSTADCVL